MQRLEVLYSPGEPSSPLTQTCLAPDPLGRRGQHHSHSGGQQAEVLEVLFNKCTGNSDEFKYLDPGVTILYGLSLISPGGNLSRSSGAFGLGNLNLW